MKSFKFRIDISALSSPDDCPAVLSSIVSDAYRYMHCYEGVQTDNPHIQGYVYTSTNDRTLRARIRKYLVKKGNAAYSIRENHEEFPVEYLGYLTKQGDFEMHNIPHEVIEQIAEHERNIRETYNKERKEKKPTKVLDKLKELVTELYGTSPLRDEIELAILRYHLDAGLIIRRSTCVAYADTLELFFMLQGLSRRTMLRNFQMKIFPREKLFS